MLMLLLLTQIFNPGLSLGILLPEDDTELFFGHLYHIRAENRFTRSVFAPGMFVDFIYKSNDIYNDPHFVNSGIKTVVKAYGGGVSICYTPHQNFAFDITLGYYTGEMSYPVANDSGIVSRQIIKRNSLGTTVSFELHEYFGEIRTGIRIYAMLIPFGERKLPDVIWFEQPLYADLEYASLSSLGIGLSVGIGGRK
jgi:hypothetical protein